MCEWMRTTLICQHYLSTTSLLWRFNQWSINMCGSALYSSMQRDLAALAQNHRSDPISAWCVGVGWNWFSCQQTIFWNLPASVSDPSSNIKWRPTIHNINAKKVHIQSWHSIRSPQNINHETRWHLRRHLERGTGNSNWCQRHLDKSHLNIEFRQMALM